MKQASTILGVAALVAMLSVPSAQARTWYVNVYGTGDAPTIWAAMDSAVAGDTVLVGPGEYEITYDTGTIDVNTGVCLKSERGPLETRLRSSGFALSFGVHVSPYGVLDGFWVEGPFVWIVSVDHASVLARCIILGWGVTTVEGAADIYNNLFLTAVRFEVSYVYFYNNIVYGRMSCGAPGPEGEVNYFYCNDILGELEPCIIWGPDANFVLDPQFCGVEGSENYYLQSSSPCAPGNTPLPFIDCGLIGPLPVGCGTVRVEETTWGRVKALYGE